MTTGGGGGGGGGGEVQTSLLEVVRLEMSCREVPVLVAIDLPPGIFF
jgi:hypothetical protein